MEQTKTKRKYNLSFMVMLFCIFCFIGQQFIPIYFVDTGFRAFFYFAVCILLTLSVCRIFFKLFRKENIFWAWFYSIFMGLITFLVFGLLTIAMDFAVWTEASTLFVKKDNPQIKIITRYVNEGAFGGGTEPDDYEIVLHRPILFFFKMETTIDTTKIVKADWLRQ